MENTTTRPMAVRISQKPLPPVFTLPLEDLIADGEDYELPEQDVLVHEILESTRCIRRRTDNREILAILDEIVWLTRSI
ncbi:MAG: hypothetical protein GY785_06605 [Gammaproteobacteria bacterium]|nr:hypothetical protein [Gammaproteobacteria bacterium]